jgi:hypothetical protein
LQNNQNEKQVLAEFYQEVVKECKKEGITDEELKDLEEPLKNFAQALMKAAKKNG